MIIGCVALFILIILVFDLGRRSKTSELYNDYIKCVNKNNEEQGIDIVINKITPPK